MKKEKENGGIMGYLHKNWDKDKGDAFRKFMERATEPPESFENAMMRCPCCDVWYFPFRDDNQFVDPEYAEKIQLMLQMYSRKWYARLLGQGRIKKVKKPNPKHYNWEK